MSFETTNANPNFPNNPGYNLYKGARYVPKFSEQPGSVWTNTIAYEPLTIVLWEGNSYTSKTFVPVGVDIKNTTYWAETGNYNAQLENVYNELSDIIKKVSALTFNTIQLMVATNLESGDIACCFGYYMLNDMPATYYFISSSGVPDGGSCIRLNNGLFANAIFDEGVYPEQFGIKPTPPSDEISSNNDAWDYYISFVHNNNHYFKLSPITYEIYQPIMISKSFIGSYAKRNGGGNTSFKAMVAFPESTLDGISMGKSMIILANKLAIPVTFPRSDVTVANLTIDCNGLAEIGFSAFTQLSTIKDISVWNSKVYGFYFYQIWQGVVMRCMVHQPLSGTGFVLGVLNGGGGTSTLFTDLYVNDSNNILTTGYSINNMEYSTFSNLACDNMTNSNAQFCYYFNNCSGSITSMGGEVCNTNVFVNFTHCRLNVNSLIAMNNVRGDYGIQVSKNSNIKIMFSFAQQSWFTNSLINLIDDGDPNNILILDMETERFIDINNKFINSNFTSYSNSTLYLKMNLNMLIAKRGIAFKPVQLVE